MNIQQLFFHGIPIYQGLVDCYQNIKALSDQTEKSTLEKIDLVRKIIFAAISLTESASSIFPKILPFLPGGQIIAQWIHTACTFTRITSSFENMMKTAKPVITDLCERKWNSSHTEEFAKTMCVESGAIITQVQDQYHVFSNPYIMLSAQWAIEISTTYDKWSTKLKKLQFQSVIEKIQRAFYSVRSYFTEVCCPPSIHAQLEIVAKNLSMHCDVCENYLSKKLLLAKNNKKFICPLTKRVIKNPLKYKHADLFFEKSAIKQKLAENPRFAFNLDKKTLLIITPDSLEESLEAKKKIISLTENYDKVAVKILTACFPEIKTKIQTIVQEAFDACTTQISSCCYWSIDPRQWALNGVRPILAKTFETQQKHFDQPHNVKELYAKIHHLQDKTLPGLLKIIRCYNWFNSFSILNRVQENLINVPEHISTVIEQALYIEI